MRSIDSPATSSNLHPGRLSAGVLGSNTKRASCLLALGRTGKQPRVAGSSLESRASSPESRVSNPMHREGCNAARVLASQHLSACAATRRAIGGLRHNRSLLDGPTSQRRPSREMLHLCPPAFQPGPRPGIAAEKGMDESWPRPFRRIPTQLQWRSLLQSALSRGLSRTWRRNSLPK